MAHTPIGSALCMFPVWLGRSVIAVVLRLTGRGTGRNIGVLVLFVMLRTLVVMLFILLLLLGHLFNLLQYAWT